MGLFDRFRTKPKADAPPAPNAADAAPTPPDAPTPAPEAQLHQGLARTRSGLLDRLTRAVAGKRTVDDDALDEIEAALLQADVGVDTTVKVIRALKARVAQHGVLSADEVHAHLHQAILSLLPTGATSSPSASPTDAPGPKPYVLLVVGVNGVGKTTTIGKLAAQFSRQGARVLLGAADTFRAAAVEQLRIWSQRTGADFVDRGMGADPAAVAYAALDEGLKRGADIVIVDTAGRLHNKVNLMNELAKVRRAFAKLAPDAPHEVLLVLDGSTGQNALQQAIEFSRATQVTALAITKLDGTAKGGVVLAIADRLQIPVRYIGVGEGVDDLQPFDGPSFVRHLFGR